jgi:putative membrane protein
MSDLNDPRVLFAAERTLLAWNRTAISMMAFGFVIERFGLFLELVGRQEVRIFQRQLSFFVGVALILLAAILLAYSVVQHRRILQTLHAGEFPTRYDTTIGMFVNGLVALLGCLLSLYLFRGFI